MAYTPALLSHRFGIGPTILLGLFGTVIFWLILPCLPPTLFGSHWYTIICYGVLVFVFDCAIMTLTLPYFTLRQKLTPDAMLGRMILTMRFSTVAMTPIGAFAGGWLGEHFNLRPALGIISACGLALGVILLLSSPLRKVRGHAGA